MSLYWRLLFVPCNDSKWRWCLNFCSLPSFSLERIYIVIVVSASSVPRQRFCAWWLDSLEVFAWTALEWNEGGVEKINVAFSRKHGECCMQWSVHRMSLSVNHSWRKNWKILSFFFFFWQTADTDKSMDGTSSSEVLIENRAKIVLIEGMTSLFFFLRHSIMF